MSKLTDFYSGVGEDCEGRLLEDILQWGPARLEFGHTYIQWVFPLREFSNFNPDAPLLTDEDIQLFKANPVMQENLLRSFKVYLNFLGLEVILGDYHKVQKAPHFEEECRGLFRQANHNWLRITRVITCLKTIGTPMLVDAADAFYLCLRKLHEEEGLVSENSFTYWTQACSIINLT